MLFFVHCTLLVVFIQIKCGFDWVAQVNISNPGSTMHDHAVNIFLDTATDKLFDRVDCSDLSFRSLDLGVLSYYREGPCDYESTSFWVVLPTINPGLTSVEVYIGSSTDSGSFLPFNGSYVGLFGQNTCGGHWSNFIDEGTGYFLRSSSNYVINQLVGSHKHNYLAGSTNEPPSSNKRVSVGDNSLINTELHTHNYGQGSTGTATVTLPFYTVQTCSSGFFSIDPKQLFPFDSDVSAVLSVDWGVFASLNSGRFVRVKNSEFGVGSSTNDHQHTISKFTTFSSANTGPKTSSTNDYNWPVQGHTHDCGPINTKFKSGDAHYPPYCKVMWYESLNTIHNLANLGGNLLVYSTVLPPLGYSIAGEFDGKFFVGTSSTSGIAECSGSETHTHTFSCTTTSQSGTKNDNTGSNSYASNQHTHVINGDTNAGSSIPSHHSLLLLRRETSLSSVVGAYHPSFYCNNTATTSPDVCSQHGSCIGENICLCDQDYYGQFCEVTSCGSVLSNTTGEVCSGHGNCWPANHCDCQSEYSDGLCSTTSCGGVSSTARGEVCSNHGECIEFDVCECQLHYWGEVCEEYQCYGVMWNDLQNVCFGNGQCVGNDECQCLGDYFGELCGNWTCFDVAKESENACQSHGICSAPDTCDCNQFYDELSEDCGAWRCNGIENTKFSVCGAHGECIEHDTCACDPEYPGRYCNSWKCFGKTYDDKLVCSGHGVCIDWDACRCIYGYNESECSEYFCNDVHYAHSSVCSAHGQCLLPGYCLCEEGFETGACSHWRCGAELMNSTEKVCSGHGQCVKPSKCKCEKGFNGAVCEKSQRDKVILESVLGGSGGLIGLIIVIGTLLSCMCVLIFRMQKRKLKKFGKLKNVDLLLEEQAIEEDTSIAHLRINKKLYEINYSELKILKRIGEGGSNSTVFLCEWTGSKLNVAFKCFRIATVFQGESNSFEEFEKELSILGSISHPHILRFYGAVLEPPRVGIVMEYCSRGDLGDYLKEYRASVDERGVSLSTKIRFLREIASGINYLHSRQLIHRDIKDGNVLVSETESAKIMDFGCSFIGEIAHTRRVGTSMFMAPEVAFSTTYSSKCDAYSFAILAWLVITENFHPFGINEGAIETKSMDESFRPSMEEFGDCAGPEWLGQLIVTNWSAKPAKRMEFTTIEKVFADNKPPQENSNKNDDDALPGDDDGGKGAGSSNEMKTSLRRFLEVNGGLRDGELIVDTIARKLSAKGINENVFS